jgi:hypothetical protein
MPDVGEVVLIYYQDQPTVYGRIEGIEPDIKKDWYHVTLLLLTLPTQVATWILRESYINGAPFTMGGRPMRLERVEKVSIRREAEGPSHTGEEKVPEKPGKVIPLKRSK